MPLIDDLQNSENIEKKTDEKLEMISAHQITESPKDLPINSLNNHSKKIKILKEFERVDCYNADDGQKKLIGIFLDVETTGTSHENDKIIELALVPFEYT